MSPNRVGEWQFPNTSMVQIFGEGHEFYRNRDDHPAGVVNLFWRENATIPTGIFCCVIPNPKNPEQKACIGVYPEGEGKTEHELINGTCF